MTERPCDSEPAAQDNTLPDGVDPAVETAAARLFELFARKALIKVDPHASAAGEGEVVLTGEFDEDDLVDEIDDFLDDLEEQDAEEREELRVRGIHTQPPLPKIFRLIIENYNRRKAILAKGAEMSRIDWIELKALNLDMKQSLRPGAERALSRADPNFSR